MTHKYLAVVPHVEYITGAFDRLQEVGLKFKPFNCYFSRNEIDCQGHDHDDHDDQ